MNRVCRAFQALGINIHSNRRVSRTAVTVVMVLVSVCVQSQVASAASLTAAKLALSDPRPSQTAVTYTVTVSGVSATALRCIKSTFVTTPSGSTAVPGMSASAATVNAGSTLLASSTGTWAAADTANSVTYTNTTNATAPGTTSGATFIIQNVTNGSTPDTSYWLQFKTYSDSACTTTIDSTTIGFIYTNGSTLSFTVDATLSFTVNAVAAGQACDASGNTTAASTATTIPFGSVNTAANGLVCQDLTAATNATNGYTIYARYTAPLSNGVSTLTDLSGATNSAPITFPAAGVQEAYGYSTNDATLTATGNGANRFTNGGQKYAAMTTTNAEVAYEAAGVTSTTYRVAHQASVITTTRPGTYTTTVIYTCTPVF